MIPKSSDLTVTKSPSCVTRLTGTLFTFLADDDELDRCSIRAAIGEFHRGVARVSHHFVVALPLAFEFLADGGVSWRQINLGRPGFFQNERRAVSALREISGEMAVRGQMRFEFGFAGAFVAESAFDRESQVGTPDLKVNELRPLHSEAGDDNMTRSSLFPRSSDRSTMSFRSRPGICAEPSQRPAGVLRRLTKRGGGEKYCGE